MYDITNRSSFDNISKWLHLLSQSVSNRIKMLVGNKLDLSEEKRIVTEEEGKQAADDSNMLFYEASGESGENVDKVFTEIAETIYENLSDDKSSFLSDSNSIQLSKPKYQKGNKKGCCK